MDEPVLSYHLDQFEGPLDLLLQLIARNKLNIYDIDLSALLDQYLEQMHRMESENLDIASEFLEMASRLVYLKTVSLLPRQEEAAVLKEALTGELLDYLLCQQIARKLGARTEGFDTFVRRPVVLPVDKTYRNVHDPALLFDAYSAAVGRGRRRLPPPSTAFTRIVAKKVVAVSTKIVSVMRRLWSGAPRKLSALFQGAKSRSELVATFLAVLELCKANRVELRGDGADADIKLVKERNRP